jgi:hypothetical protein
LREQAIAPPEPSETVLFAKGSSPLALEPPVSFSAIAILLNTMQQVDCIPSAMPFMENGI